MANFLSTALIIGVCFFIFSPVYAENNSKAKASLPKIKLYNKLAILSTTEDGGYVIAIQAQCKDKKRQELKYSINISGKTVLEGALNLKGNKLQASAKLPQFNSTIKLKDIIIEFENGDKISKIHSGITPFNIPLIIKSDKNGIIVDIAEDAKKKLAFLGPFKVNFFRIGKKGLPELFTHGELDKPVKIADSSRKTDTVSLEVTASNGDVVGRKVLSFKKGQVINLQSNDTNKTVIAMSAFADFTNADTDNTELIMAVRDRVVSDLMQSYNCIILSRSNGISLTTENKLNQFSGGEKGKTVSKIPAADYAISGYFLSGKITAKRTLDFNKCQYYLANLRDLRAPEKKTTIVAEYRNCYSNDLTDSIARTLKLTPKTYGTNSKSAEKLDETWAVLPFSRLDNKPVDADLNIKLELSLQERVKNVVDHNDIDKILKELKINSLNGSTESAAAGLARILGADRVVMGTVSRHKYEGDSRMRLDMFLVDGKSAVILDTASSVLYPGNLEKAASEILLDMASRNIEPPIIDESTQAMRYKEATLYQNYLNSIEKFNIDEKLGFKIGLDLAEAAYMLVSDDPVRSYTLGYKLLWDVMWPFKEKASQEDKERCLSLINKLLANLNHSKQTSDPLTYRAVAYNIAGKHDEAILLIKERLKKYPDTNNTYPYAILGETYYLLKDYDNAAKYIELGRWQFVAIRVGLTMYRELGNEEKEYEFLRKLKINKFPSKDYSVRRFMLTRKLDGPDAALRYFNTLSSWITALPEIQMELAQTWLAKGEKRKAALIATRLDNKKTLSNLNFDKEKFKTDLKNLIKVAGKAQMNWKTPAEIHKIPEKYKLYVQPLGTVDMELINKSVPALEKYTGAKVKVLPVLPMPDDPGAFKKARGQYQGRNALVRISRVLIPPKDALMVFFITGDDIYAANLRFVYSTSIYKTHVMISYSRWKYLGRANIIKMLAREMGGRFTTLAIACTEPLPDDLKRLPWRGGRGCTNIPCMQTGSGFSDGALKKKAAICEDCQEKYKNIKIENIFNAFQNVRQHFWDSEKRRLVFEQYRKKIEEFQKKNISTSDKDKENNKTGK